MHRNKGLFILVSQGKPQGWANTPSLSYKEMQFEELTECSHQGGHACNL